MRVPPAGTAVLRLGALLHDIGKIGVPDDVLRKPGATTDVEYDTIKPHPVLGARILRSVVGRRVPREDGRRADLQVRRSRRAGLKARATREERTTTAYGDERGSTIVSFEGECAFGYTKLAGEFTRTRFHTSEATVGFHIGRELTTRVSCRARKPFTRSTWDQQAGLSLVWTHRWW